MFGAFCFALALFCFRIIYFRSTKAVRFLALGLLNVEIPSLPDALAQRIAARDQPSPPDPHRHEPAQVAKRLGAAAATRFGFKDPRRARTLGRVLLALIQSPGLSREELGRAIGLHYTTAVDAATLLCDAKLVQTEWDKHFCRYSLSRVGEDWALPIVQDEAPPGT